jgi:hypothetical protein
MRVSREGYMPEGTDCTAYTWEKEKRDASGQTAALSRALGDP